MSTIVMAVDSREPDRLFASSLLAMHQRLDVSVAQLSRASGTPRSVIEAIEAGGTATRAQRHDIGSAVRWLSDHHVAMSLT